ncbi:MAG: hypothetical protein ACE5DQ_00680 [Candidatus Paceibacterota bacterium]
MKSVRDVLKKFDPVHDKYISREYQSYGVHLSEKLHDERRKSLYIKFAKEMPRPVLEEALRFVIDSGARRRGALFMWKLKEMGAFEKGDKQKANTRKGNQKGRQKGKL